MILGFKPQFVESILNGKKIHTIREDAKGRWTAERPIQFATGVRTKKYKQFHTGVCHGVQQLTMRFSISKGGIYIQVDNNLNKILTNHDVERLAISDGFDSKIDFEKWFLPLIVKSNHRFDCKIIHWTDYRY